MRSRFSRAPPAPPPPWELNETRRNKYAEQYGRQAVLGQTVLRRAQETAVAGSAGKGLRNRGGRQSWDCWSCCMAAATDGGLSDLKVCIGEKKLLKDWGLPGGILSYFGVMLSRP